MPLYTSSFDKIPQAPYKKMWLLAFIILALMIGSSEIYHRAKGHLPGVSDDKDLWSYWRSKIYKNQKDGKEVIVILGASRAQLGIIPDIIEKNFPQHRVVMLTMYGSFPCFSLKHIADDEKFKGVVLYSVEPWTIYEKKHYYSQRIWCEYYDSNWRGLSRYGKWAELMLKAGFQQKFVILNSNLNFKNQIFNYFKVKPSYTLMQFNRFRPAFFYTRVNKNDLEGLKQIQIQRLHDEYIKDYVYTKDEYEDFLKTEIKPLVDKIQSRGSKVIFIEMPTSPVLRDVISKRYPKETFWDSISRHTGAKTIHFADYKEFENLICPDTSHLDIKDAVFFTENLSEIMIKRIKRDGPFLFMVN